MVIIIVIIKISEKSRPLIRHLDEVMDKIASFCIGNVVRQSLVLFFLVCAVISVTLCLALLLEV